MHRHLRDSVGERGAGLDRGRPDGGDVDRDRERPSGIAGVAARVADGTIACRAERRARTVATGAHRSRCVGGDRQVDRIGRDVRRVDSGRSDGCGPLSAARRGGESYDDEGPSNQRDGPYERSGQGGAAGAALRLPNDRATTCRRPDERTSMRTDSRGRWESNPCTRLCGPCVVLCRPRSSRLRWIPTREHGHKRMAIEG